MAAPGLQFPVRIKEIAQRSRSGDPDFHRSRGHEGAAGLNILPGMTSSVTLTYRRASILGGRILVPISAVLQESSGEQVVWILGPDLIVRRSSVKLGEATGGQVEILSGLQPGDRIAVAGVTFFAGRHEGRVTSATPSGQPAMNPGEFSVKN